MLWKYGDDVKVVQELMRHAKITTTMEIYTHARMEKKRQAQIKVVDVLFGRERGFVPSLCPFCALGHP